MRIMLINDDGVITEFRLRIRTDYNNDDVDDNNDNLRPEFVITLMIMTTNILIIRGQEDRD